MAANKRLSNNQISNYLIYDGEERTILQEYSRKIKASEKIRSEINLEDDPMVILDKSLLCISLILNDMTFYKFNKQKLKDYMVED